MLGYAGLDWFSVRTTEAPPRPELEPLTGGYRKIPVAQIGADIFCDTRVIAREIGELTHRPELLSDELPDDATALIRRAEDELFFACGLSATSITLTLKMFRMMSIAEFIHFIKDRTAMNKDATIPFPGMKQSRQQVQEHLETIESLLENSFLFGDHPNLADFSAYHGLWMIHVLGEKRFIRRFPKTIAWIERMQRFGLGKGSALEATAALEIARAANPRMIPADHQQSQSIGRTVEISPADYAKDGTRGTLIGESASTWTLARSHKRAGTVHVHFPKQGYTLTLLN